MTRQKQIIPLVILLVILLIAGVIIFWTRYSKITESIIFEKTNSLANVLQGRASALIEPASFQKYSSANAQKEFANFFAAIQSPELVRIKIWDTNSTVVWSDQTTLIGSSFPQNSELKEALQGKNIFELGDDEPENDEASTERSFESLSEVYIPVRDTSGNILGIVEIYIPRFKTTETIKQAFLKENALIFFFFSISYVMIIFRFVSILRMNRKT